VWVLFFDGGFWFSGWDGGWGSFWLVGVGSPAGRRSHIFEVERNGVRFLWLYLDDAPFGWIQYPCMSDASSTRNFPSDSVQETGGEPRRRIVKKMPAMEPLEPERRYVQPHQAHVSVFTGFVGWAFSQRKGRKPSGRRLKMNRSSFGPDGLQAPTVQSRDRAKFTNYFAFGTEKDLRPRDAGGPLNVHRNRVVFLSVLAVVVVYSLFWVAG